MGAIQAKELHKETHNQAKPSGSDPEIREERRISDSIDTLNLSHIPNDIINSWNFNCLNDSASPSKDLDEFMYSQESRSSRNSISLEHTIKDCLSNLNCVTDLCPRFSYQIDKFNNKFALGDEAIRGIFESDLEACEVPDNCNEMEL
ncbi:unnamed protein product [Blepharisma stoltei]|uniref:Uncharacterized protein n=1 Tax=Blepharisma stoltei TaxID=1481888 RepID=A0AAU9JJB7_9CILI|nr:unnamed protein product [Blepharisma stoltei]